MTASPFPHDPWGRCNCPPEPLPSGTDPRLCAFVSARKTEHGGVIELSGALWGGEWRRTVPLSREQAVRLADELLGWVARLQALDSPRPGSASAKRRAPAGRKRARYGEVTGYPRPRIRPGRSEGSGE